MLNRSRDPRLLQSTCLCVCARASRRNSKILAPTVSAEISSSARILLPSASALLSGPSSSALSQPGKVAKISSRPVSPKQWRSLDSLKDSAPVFPALARRRRRRQDSSLLIAGSGGSSGSAQSVPFSRQSTAPRRETRQDDRATYFVLLRMRLCARSSSRQEE